MSRVWVMGFIGAGNAGDEAILAGTLHLLRQRGVKDIGVFSWNPQETERTHRVECYPVLPGFAGLVAFARVLRRGDLLLLGGGSLLQDGEPRIVPFWLARALAAKAKGCRVVFHAQGVGPLRTAWARCLVRLVVPLTASLVTVRDTDSQRLLGFAKPHLVADPALVLPPVRVPKSPRLAVVALRHIAGAAKREASLVETLESLARQYALEYAFLPMHRPDDVALAESLALRLRGTVVSYESLTEVRERLAAAQIVIAMRLHAAILAVGVNTPVVGVAYDPKVRSFFQSMGLEGRVLPWDSDFSGEDFARVVQETLAYREEPSTADDDALAPMRARAALAVDLALAVGGIVRT